MTTIYRIGTGVALALALAASAAPASAGVLDPNANGSYVPAGGVDPTQVLSPSPRGVAIVLGQAPSARPAEHPNRGGAPASATRLPADSSSPAGDTPRGSAASPGNTFEWGAAGIGAAGMLLLVSAGIAVAVTTRRQRRRLTTS
jgi:hypothetical protein